MSSTSPALQEKNPGRIAWLSPGFCVGVGFGLFWCLFGCVGVVFGLGFASREIFESSLYNFQ